MISLGGFFKALVAKTRISSSGLNIGVVIGSGLILTFLSMFPVTSSTVKALDFDLFLSLILPVAVYAETMCPVPCFFGLTIFTVSKFLRPSKDKLFSSVLFLMLGYCHKFKIAKAVIISNFVFMMNYLASLKKPTNFRLHDKAMLFDVSVFHCKRMFRFLYINITTSTFVFCHAIKYITYELQKIDNRRSACLS